MSAIGLRAGILILALVTVPACSRELTREEAQGIIERHDLIGPTVDDLLDDARRRLENVYSATAELWSYERKREANDGGAEVAS